jgi:hypothetical protein
MLTPETDAEIKIQLKGHEITSSMGNIIWEE